MTIFYEWVCEVCSEHGDREELLFADSFADAMRYASHPPDAGYTYEIALWRKQYAPDDEGDLREIQYGYLETATGECWAGNGTTSIAGARMSTTFDGGANVPKRFLQEVQKYVDRHR